MMEKKEPQPPTGEGRPLVLFLENQRSRMAATLGREVTEQEFARLLGLPRSTLRAVLHHVQAPGRRVMAAVIRHYADQEEARQSIIADLLLPAEETEKEQIQQEELLAS